MTETTKSSKTETQPSTKAVGWKTVSVFVSSTFDDMHAERDYLVKEVFPRLREWCEQRRLRLVDVDLRWGVTEADATNNKRVVDVCLRRIDDCRPFFICLLGQRYGWIPRRQDVAAETSGAYPHIAGALGAASVTEMEIQHSTVAGKHVSDAFFYLREPSNKSWLFPDQVVRLSARSQPRSSLSPRLAQKRDLLKGYLSAQFNGAYQGDGRIVAGRG